MKCFGCATSFKEGEKLHLQGLHVQYKNYNLPIREQKPIRTLLKTIVSFINSQGGTIFIGVQDTKGEVKGVPLQDDSKEDFTKFFQNLISKIRPEINTLPEPLVKLYYVPVVSKKQFQGKYLIKIIVKQGDPARYYCFSQNIHLNNGKESQQYENISSFIRTNMGCVEEIKGLNLLKEIRQRALVPRVAKTIFHPGCNPQPLNLEETGFAINIAHVSQDEFKDLQLFFKKQFQIMELPFNAVYVNQKHALVLKYEKENEFSTIKTVMRQSLEYFNEENKTYQFKIKEEKKKYFTLKKLNKFEEDKSDDETKESEIKKIEDKKIKKKTQEKVSDKSKETPKIDKDIDHRYQNSKKTQVKKQKKEKGEKHYVKQDLKKVEKKSTNYKQEIFQKNNKMREEQVIIHSEKKKMSNFPKKYSLTFTHLDPNSIQNFIMNLKMMLQPIQFQTNAYKNSLQVFFRDQQSKQDAEITFIEQEKALSLYSFKQKGLYWGKNIKILSISNYNKDKRNQLKQYLEKLIKNELRVCCFQKMDNKFVLLIQFNRPDAACRWLDTLLSDYSFKQRFAIPSKNGNVPKIKIILQLENELRECALFEEMMIFE